MASTRPRGVTKVHWIALVVLLLTLACALGLHGWVTGEVRGAGTVRLPGDDQQVPAAVRNGGPVIGPHAGLVDTLRIPPRTIVLSFDDGPDPTWTPKVLDVLARHHVHGTFFVLGSEVLRHPDLVRRAWRRVTRSATTPSPIPTSPRSPRGSSSGSSARPSSP